MNKVVNSNNLIHSLLQPVSLVLDNRVNSTQFMVQSSKILHLYFPQIKDFQALAFMAGANGMLIGGYLTIKGRSVEEDRRMVSEVEKLWQN